MARAVMMVIVVVVVALSAALGGANAVLQPPNAQVTNLQTPSLQIFPPNAARGEYVRLDGNQKPTKVLFGPTNGDPNFNAPVLLALQACPSYLGTTKARCVQIPENAWGGPQTISVGKARAVVGVFGEALPKPKELSRDTQQQKDLSPLLGRKGDIAPVKDLTTALMLWMPESVRQYIGDGNKDKLLEVLQRPNPAYTKKLQFSPKEYEMQPLSDYVPLGGFEHNKSKRNICAGYLRLLRFTVPGAQQDRLGFVSEQLRRYLVAIGQAENIDPFLELSADPMPSFAIPAAQPATNATRNDTPLQDIAASNDGGDGTTIAVLDTGVTPDENVFGDTSRIVDAQNFANWLPSGGGVSVPDGSGTTNDDFHFEIDAARAAFGGIDAKTYDAHGTAVAALAAGLEGVAPKANIMPVKVCRDNGACSLPAVIQGTCYALNAGSRINGPENLVINMSLGGDTPSGILAGVLQNGTEAGVAVVASAGNEWRRRKSHVGVLNHYPANARDTTGKMIPGIIGVGAVGHFPSGLEPGDFSQEGNYLDTLAPGVKVVVKIPSLPATSTDEYDGTSFAAPIVAGAIAQAKSMGATQTPAAFESAARAMPCATMHVPTVYGTKHLLDKTCFP